MVFCAYAEKLFWEGDGKHPHPQSTVSCKHTLSELCQHQPHSQVTPRFYLAAMIKILEWPWNEATHHTTWSSVCRKSVMRFYIRLSICEYATNILTPIHVPVKLHITWRWVHFLSNWMLICFMLKLSHCKERCVHTFNIVSVLPCFISIDWLATPLWGMLWVPESPHSRWILPVCATHCTLKKSIAGIHKKWSSIWTYAKCWALFLCMWTYHWFCDIFGYSLTYAPV